MRDRIRELRRVRAGDLYPNPDNWRIHGDAQRQAMQTMLERIGYADALIARERPDGGLELLDGHLRREVTPEAEVPVLVVDLDDDEARTLLATLDPLASMAQANSERLGGLIGQIEDEALRSLAQLVAAGETSQLIEQQGHLRSCCSE